MPCSVGVGADLIDGIDIGGGHVQTWPVSFDTYKLGGE
jgi:hypothetical protein